MPPPGTALHAVMGEDGEHVVSYNRPLPQAIIAHPRRR